MEFGLSKDVRHGAVVLTLTVSGVPGDVMSPEFEAALLDAARTELASAVDQQIERAANVLANLDPALFDDVVALATQKQADASAVAVAVAEPSVLEKSQP